VAGAICPGNIQENVKTRPEGGLETSEFEKVKAAVKLDDLAGDADSDPIDPTQESGTRVLGWERRD
jgi:hypothetical protein